MYTTSYRNTVLKRIRESPKFAQAVYSEAIEAILRGEREEGLSMLRDLVNAGQGFPALARETSIPEKSLQRALSKRGNPTLANFSKITASLLKSVSQLP